MKDNNKMERELFVYLDPGFMSEVGHYRNFANKIQSYATNKSIDVQHYVNINISEKDKRLFNLSPVFKYNAFLDERVMDSEVIIKHLSDFKNKVSDIFNNLLALRDKYANITIYMYTCHTSHILILMEMYKKINYKNIDMHLVLFYLNHDILEQNNSPIALKSLQEINRLNHSNNIFLHIDSSRAASIYQKYFDKKIQSFPIPLHFKMDINSKLTVKQNKEKITLSFFGYADYKYGFHLFYEVYKYFSNHFTYTVRINNKYTNQEFKDNIATLRSDENVLLIDEYLEEGEYRELFIKSDIVIIPYLNEYYPVQTSGIFIDSVWMDKLVITTVGTWMSDQVKILKNGFIFKNNCSKSLINKIIIAEQKINNFKIKKNCKIFKSNFTVEEMFEKFKESRLLNQHEAYKDKNFVFIAEKKKNYNKLLEVLKPFKKKYETNIRSKHLVYPSLSSIEQFEDLLNKLLFSLPDDGNVSLVFIIPKQLNFSSFSAYKEKYKYISFITNSEIKKYRIGSVLLIHDVTSLKDIDDFDEFNGVEIIDSEYYSDIEAETLRNLYYKTINKAKQIEFSEVSKHNFRDFKRKNKDREEAYCFTTGPTFDSYKEFDFSAKSLKVICNSLVKNEKFLNKLGRVDALTFGDPVFHFGPSKYAQEFRKDVLKLVEKYYTYLVINEINVPLMLMHYPELKDKIIGIPSRINLNFPSEEDFFVKSTSNILTLFMIPLASSISDTIFIMGADGRQNDEKYFWKHSSSAQYDSLMEDAFRTHPSFFRDRDYNDYYDEHCSILENLILFGEKHSKVYCSITDSYIPALHKRFIDIKQNFKQVELEIKVRREDNLKFKGANTNMINVNYDFTLKMNILFTYINKLKEEKCKLAIYGNGLVGQIIARELPDQVVVIFDKDVTAESDIAQVSHPSNIKNYNFSLLVISVLGREEEIINSLDIDENRCYQVDLTREARSIKRLDVDSRESKENNLNGPFTRDSKVSLDETLLVSKYFESMKPGLMIDVGAHHGSSSRMFLEKDWKVYAYEPDVNNRKELDNNLMGYSNLIISDKAVSNVQDEELDFFTSEESSGISGLSSFTKGHKKTDNVFSTTLEYEMKINHIVKVDFLKIGTEGYDLMVLKGFPWKFSKPTVIECEFENSKTISLGYNVMDMINFLMDKGYTVYVSEWYPIVRYGIRHDWKRFFKYENQLIDSLGWGNLIAFKDAPDEKLLLENLTRLI